MAYDSRHDRTILFSGETGQTWSYSYATNAWVNMNPPAPRPAADTRGTSNMVYDSNRGVVVLISYADNRFWAYDYGLNRWSQRALAPGRNMNGGAIYFLAYDSLSDKYLWYGDDRRSLIYNWNTNSWTTAITSQNPPAHHANMVYAPNLNRIIFYGGILGPGMNQTWEFVY